MKRSKIAVAAVAALMSFGAANPAGATPVNRNFSVSVTLSAALVVESLDCSNSVGHYITVGGSTDGLPPIWGKATFKSPSNKADVSSFDSMLLDAGQPQTIDKRGVGGGVGGNPWIYIAGDGESPTLLGRCVQGFRAAWNHNKDVTIPVSTISTALDCGVKASSLEVKPNNQPGASQGVTFTFDNKSPDNPSAPRPHKGSATVNLSLDSQGGAIAVGDHRGSGIGGNPDIYLNVGKDRPTTEGVYLGRCRALY